MIQDPAICAPYAETGGDEPRPYPKTPICREGVYPRPLSLIGATPSFKSDLKCKVIYKGPYYSRRSDHDAVPRNDRLGA